MCGWRWCLGHGEEVHFERIHFEMGVIQDELHQADRYVEKRVSKSIWSSIVHVRKWQNEGYCTLSFQLDNVDTLNYYVNKGCLRHFLALAWW